MHFQEKEGVSFRKGEEEGRLVGEQTRGAGADLQAGVCSPRPLGRKCRARPETSCQVPVSTSPTVHSFGSAKSSLLLIQGFLAFSSDFAPDHAFKVAQF